MKEENAPYQPPGCNMEATNGIKLPAFIQIPIEKNSLDPTALIGWEKTKGEILAALGAKRR